MNKLFKYLPIIILVLVAFWLRIFVLGHSQIPVADSAEYLELAKNLAAGNGYQLSTWWTYHGTYPDHPLHPDASRQPLYPSILAVLYKIFIPSFTIAQWLSLVFGMLNIYLVYLIGIRLFGRMTALLSVFFTAINAAHIWFSTQAYSETLFCSVFYIIIFMFVTDTIRTRKHFVALGVCLGLLYLTRLNGAFIIISALITLKLLFPAESGQGRWAPLIFTACAAIIVVSPWFIRNSMTFQNPLKTGGAYMNYVDSFEEMHAFHDREPGLSTYLSTHTPPQMIERYAKGLMRSARCIILGNMNYHDPYPQGPFTLFMIFSLITVYYCNNHRRVMIIYLSFLFHFIFVSWTLLGIFRYYMCFYPLMILWGIAGMETVSEKISTRIHNSNHYHPVKIFCFLVPLAASLYFCYSPLNAIMRHNDNSDYLEITECINWVQDNTSANDVIIDFPVFIEMIFKYERGTLVTPSGSIDNLLKAARIFNASYLVISSELLELRPDLKPYWSISSNKKLKEIQNIPFGKKLFASSGNRFMIYSIDAGSRSTGL